MTDNIKPIWEWKEEEIYRAQQNIDWRHENLVSRIDFNRGLILGVISGFISSIVASITLNLIFEEISLLVKTLISLSIVAIFLGLLIFSIIKLKSWEADKKNLEIDYDIVSLWTKEGQTRMAKALKKKNKEMKEKHLEELKNRSKKE